jgi:acetoacetyl-CoA synthetase
MSPTRTSLPDEPEVLWRPPTDVRSTARIGAYLGWLERERGLRFTDYAQLWEWSVTDLDAFWGSIWDHFEVQADSAPERVLGNADGSGRGMPGARWFPGSRVNYAAQALVPGGVDDTAVAVVAHSQSRERVELTWAELRAQVARAAAGLRGLGVGPGDRVAAYLPNTPETLVAFLATASLGAVWSSCAPEFGTRSVLDRFQQIEPAVLLAVDGYRYGSRAIGRTTEVADIRAALPSLTATVAVPYLDSDAPPPPGAIAWSELLARGTSDLSPEWVAFDHPLYILYSSGTTGLPKPIVHGHGGIIVEHLKALALHGDLGPGDRFFWFSTTGWMMWNYLVSGLLVGATIVLFDGDPGWPDLDGLWALAEAERLTSFGTSAPFLLACRKAALEPGRDHDLSALRGIGSTGAPLPAEGFRWVAGHVSASALLASISGGTDVCTAFVGAVPLLPVRAGQIPCRLLGAAVAAFDAAGAPVVDQLGELVVTEPMPSMPVALWGDPDGSRLRSAYFDTYPGVWRHGDWITIDRTGACVITGRSDATLNRGGVRLGTSDFYAVVEAAPEVGDSLVVHLEDPEGGPGDLLLFVAPAAGAFVDESVVAGLRAALRTQLSPRHVPDRIEVVATIPRTLSGKKLEVPVKRILGGTPVDEALNRGALADPASVAPFEAYAAEHARSTPPG